MTFYMWWLNQKNEDIQLEINLDELKKFILTESLFMKEMDILIENGFSYQNIITGKSFLFLSEALITLWNHIINNLNFFYPKEVRQ